MELQFSTKGFNEIRNITPDVQSAVRSAIQKAVSPAGAQFQNGVAHLFVVGSTVALTIIEYERGALADLQRALERVAPMSGEYAHEEAYHDGNGYAHIRAALMKPDLCIPIRDGTLALGTWQQIVLIDFDNRPRKRTVLVTLTGAI